MPLFVAQVQATVRRRGRPLGAPEEAGGVERNSDKRRVVTRRRARQRRRCDCAADFRQVGRLDRRRASRRGGPLPRLPIALPHCCPAIN